MRLLALHQNFPGQFGHMVRTWQQRPGWQIRGIGRDTAPGLAGFDALTRYKPARGVRNDQHPYLRTMENATLHGQAVARVMLNMKRQGFVPDAVLAHPGWGESLYVKDVFPDTRLVHFCEWYYSAQGADVGFDPEFPASFDDGARVRTWNALHALNLTQCDAAVTPTQWQWSRHPENLRSRILVQHEGIDINGLGPDPNASLRMPSGRVLNAGDRVVTYVARNLEPCRGFHVFMRMLAALQRQDKTVQAVIVGGDGVSYGKRPVDAKNWRENLTRELELDPLRTHFLGRVPRDQYIKVLQVSAAHVYLTYPFVLSWSLLEALACGTPLVASDTAPVREVIRGPGDATLVDFFDTRVLTQAVAATLDNQQDLERRRLRAKQVGDRYDQRFGSAVYARLLEGSSMVRGVGQVNASDNQAPPHLTASEPLVTTNAEPPIPPPAMRPTAGNEVVHAKAKQQRPVFQPMQLEGSSNA
jgi:glycosyltransferase involved in cell wall biosynthesis